MVSKFKLAPVLALTCGFSAFAAELSAPFGLTAEYRDDPVGIDTQAPRLSWKLAPKKATGKGLTQESYQIRVATDPGKLNKDGAADLWDSGRVVSGQSLNVIYSGRPPVTSQRCWWSVRVWDNRGGKPTEWSRPARWVMGVVQPNDWKAKWIGANDATRPKYDLKGAEWIYTGDQELGKMPSGTTYYCKEFDLPAELSGKTAVLAVAADNSWIIIINGKNVSQIWGHVSNEWERMRFQDVAPALKPGKNFIMVEVANKDPGPTGLLMSIQCGGKLLVKSDGSWLGTAKPGSGWQKLTAPPEGWKPVRTVGKLGVAPWGDRVKCRVEVSSPAFEKHFNVGKGLREAVLHITGVGFYEASLNGKRIGDKVLDPSPTRYDRRVLYSTYDLTDSLRTGDNTLKVLVGHGWYDVRSIAVWNFDIAPWRDSPRMIAQLDLVYDDGTRRQVVSDGTWRQVASPVGYDCIREGEVIGVNPNGGIDLERNTVNAKEVSGPGGRLYAETIAPSKVHQTFKPASVTEVKPGVWMVDFGQNLSGWVKMTPPAQKPGDVIRIRYGEKKNPDGTLSMSGTEAHFRYSASFFALPGGWFQTDRYVCSGTPGETYEPRFTYNGFQYAEITGLAQPPTAETIEARAVYTDFDDAGTFECSNQLLNRIQQATIWAYRSNFADGYPTDCPHREKNGWTGDAQLASEQAMYNFQNVAGYEKWLNDLMDEQQKDGNLPGIVPTSGWGYAWGNGPAWDSALVIIPWMLYVYGGDEQILQKAYPAMARYVDYMTSRSHDGGLVSHGLGDWCPWKANTPTVVTSTGYYHLDARIVAETARILGRTADAEKYAALADQIRDAFNRTQYKGNGVYANGTQTAQGCALHQGLAPTEETEKIRARLCDAVKATGGFLDFGILGSKYVLRALSDAGRTDLAYAMTAKEQRPSWGAWIKDGGTTLWEDWGQGSSRNHIMFGDISAWFYQYLAGIRLAPKVSAVAAGTTDTASVGMKRFMLAPEPVNGLDWVKAKHDSPYGTIRSEWKREGEKFVWTFEVPVNTSALVVMPEFAKGRFSAPEGSVSAKSPFPGREAFEVGSGCYRVETGTAGK